MSHVTDKSVMMIALDLLFKSLTDTYLPTNYLLQSAANDATIEKLKAKVKEDEGLIGALKSEKDRLEQYTRKTLQTVQEKVGR